MDPETLKREFRTEHDADVWLDHLANTRGLAGASFTQLGGGRLRVTARLAPRADDAEPNPGAAGPPTEVTSPGVADEQDDVTSPEQLTLGW
uniref:hypothetical protein n=1 Tax=Amycolatopsis sp. CA-082387 TaxID=3239918 RepID=UPI003F496F75